MGQLISFVTPLHIKTKRNYLERMIDNKVFCMQKAKEYAFDYWDGVRRFGYGGYNYRPGYWKPVAEQLIERYNLSSGSRVLDVGCGKAFLLYELQLLIPDLQIVGFDYSQYALDHHHPEFKGHLFRHCAQDPYPFDDEWLPPPGVSVVYICAAVTSLMMCQRNPIKSARINVHNTIKIAKKCIENGIFVIFPSTSQVFDGSAPKRKFDEKLSPETEYGRQKAIAEQKLLELGSNVAIVRLSKIISRDMPLIRTWMDNITSSQIIRPFSNYVFSPVPIDLVKDLFYRIGNLRIGGIYQISGSEDITYADAAYHIVRKLNLEDNLVIPTTIENAGVIIEHNPRFTTLDSTRIENTFGIIIPDAFSAIDQVFFYEK